LTKDARKSDSVSLNKESARRPTPQAARLYVISISNKELRRKQRGIAPQAALATSFLATMTELNIRFFVT
jgi:hypothetical protein